MLFLYNNGAMPWNMRLTPSNAITLALSFSLPGKKAMDCKWVFKIKRKFDDSIERYKAWLVILGNTLVERQDYNETFALIAKIVTVRTLLSVVTAWKWEIYHLDIRNAFLHGDLYEEVYVKLPSSFSRGKKGKYVVCRNLYMVLNKLLVTGSINWLVPLNNVVSTVLLGLLFITYSAGHVFLCVLVYVDDLMITGNNLESLRKFKSHLSSCFHTKDLGPLKYFLGIEVAQNNQGIYLCRCKYAFNIHTDTDMLASKSSSLPMEQNHQLGKAKGSFLP